LTPAAAYAGRSSATADADRLFEEELAGPGVVRDRPPGRRRRAGEAEAVVGEVEGRQDALDRQEASESAPTKSRIWSMEWVAAISSVSTCVSMP
jgi:hypothetical protein